MRRWFHHFFLAVLNVLSASKMISPPSLTKKKWKKKFQKPNKKRTKTRKKSKPKQPTQKPT